MLIIFIDFEDIQEDLTLSPDSRQLADYDEYYRRELPRAVRAALEESIQNQSQPIEENLRNRLMDIIRDCQDLVSTRYRSSIGIATGISSRNPTSSRSPTITDEGRTNVPSAANITSEPLFEGIAPFFQAPSPQIHLQSRLQVSDLQYSAPKAPDGSDPSDSGYSSNESGNNLRISPSSSNSSDDASLSNPQPHTASRPSPPPEHDPWDMENALLETDSGRRNLDSHQNNTFDNDWFEYDSQLMGDNSGDPFLGCMSMENPFASDDSL